MQIEALGHVVIRVRDLARAEAFYHGLLGIPIRARASHGSMTFYTLGARHGFAVCALGDAASAATQQTLGLDRVAFRLAGGPEALAAAKARLEAAGIRVVGQDPVVTKSLHLRDPDGNGVELFVDGAEDGRRDPSVFLSEARALELPPVPAGASDAAAPATGPRIRIARPADGPRVRALVAAFRDHLAAEAPTDDDLDALLPGVLADPSLEFACAELDGEAVGYTQTRFYASLWCAGLEALLEDLFVLPSARGRGVGRGLLQHALERARARGARLLGLTTNERNLRAQDLYRSQGLAPQRAKIWQDGREIRWTIALGEPLAPG